MIILLLLTECSIKSDVVFVIDSSNSVTPEDFTEARNLIYKFTNQLSISVNNSIGIINVGTEAIVHQRLGIILNSQANKNKILEMVNETHHLREFTNTADGLCKLRNQDWRNDSGVLQLAIVLTDGMSNYVSEDCGRNSTRKMASLIRMESRILVFAVGIGQRVNTDELSLIASRSHLATKLKTYDELDSFNGILHYQICSTCT